MVDNTESQSAGEANQAFEEAKVKIFEMAETVFTLIEAKSTGPITRMTIGDINSSYLDLNARKDMNSLSAKGRLKHIIGPDGKPVLVELDKINVFGIYKTAPAKFETVLKIGRHMDRATQREVEEFSLSHPDETKNIRTLIILRENDITKSSLIPAGIAVPPDTKLLSTNKGVSHYRSPITPEDFEQIGQVLNEMRNVLDPERKVELDETSSTASSAEAFEETPREI